MDKKRFANSSIILKSEEKRGNIFQLLLLPVADLEAYLSLWELFPGQRNFSKV